MGDRFVKSDESRNVKLVDANKQYGWARIQNLSYAENKFD